MMRVKVLSERFTLGAVGEVVDVDASAVNVAALVRSRIVEPAKKRRPVVVEADTEGEDG